MNAKEELLEIVQKNNLEILKIDCHFEDDNDLPCDIPLTTLDELDHEYDDCSGLRHLYGEVYCIDKKTHEPVWLTREEYDGIEWWDFNRIPQFYFERINIFKIIEANKDVLKRLKEK